MGFRYSTNNNDDDDRTISLATKKMKMQSTIMKIMPAVLGEGPNVRAFVRDSNLRHAEAGLLKCEPQCPRIHCP